jgi:hypothetical protein
MGLWVNIKRWLHTLVESMLSKIPLSRERSPSSSPPFTSTGSFQCNSALASWNNIAGGCFFTLNCFIFLQKLFYLIQFHLLFLAIISQVIVDQFRKVTAYACIWSISQVFSSSSLKDSGLKLGYLIHFEMFLVHGKRQESSFYLLYVDI